MLLACTGLVCLLLAGCSSSINVEQVDLSASQESGPVDAR